MKVKVLLDISKPLKRWLRLKLDKSDNIVVVALKYERLPEFCYACGRIGHGIKDCPDGKARKRALDGPDKSKPKPYQIGSGNSSDRDRSLDRSSGTPGEGSAQRVGSLVSQDGESANVIRGAKKMMSVNLPETLKLVDGLGPPLSDKNSIEGPSVGPDLGTIGSQLGETFAGPVAVFGEPNEDRVVISKSVGQPVKPTLKTLEQKSDQMQQTEMQVTPKNRVTKKWKRSAREGQSRMPLGKISSPLHRLLAVSKSSLKVSKSRSSPSSSGKKRTVDKGKGISLDVSSPMPHQPSPSKMVSSQSGVEIQVCKRKVNFEDLMEYREPKKGGFHVDCVGKSGGLMLLWKDSVEVLILSCSLRHIDARGSMGIRLLVKGRIRGLSFVVSEGLMTFPGCVAAILSNSFPKFRQAVEDCDLVDLGFSGPSLTWNNKRDGRMNIQERLDRFLADNQWRDRFLDIRVDHLGFNVSDHRMILLVCSTVPQVHQGLSRAFRFEPFWLKDADFGRVIDAVWKETGHTLSVLALKRKLELCATTLSAWSRRKFGNIRRQIETKNREIDRLYKCCGKPGVMTNISQLERAVEGLLECEEIYWKQMSRADWLQAGDRNSKFFHAKATASKKKNSIDCLVDTAGRSHNTEEGMARTVKDFFGSVFQSTSPSEQDIERASAGIKTRVCDDSSMGLSSAFTADDVRTALFSLSPTKAPDPDGFQAIFFQKCWGSIGGKVSRVCLRILNGVMYVREFNITNVVLIPKKKDPRAVTDFRPISLCSVIYKIVT
ncbi:hypothetical protein Dsin_008499, partial [Dipteronia sinensis]